MTRNFRKKSAYVGKPLSLVLLLGALVACAAAPIDKAKLQVDRDWARAVASAEKYQQLQRMMLQGAAPASAQTPAASPPAQPLLTPEEHRRQEIEQREKVYSDEWRVLEHDVAKRVLQRGL